MLFPQLSTVYHKLTTKFSLEQYHELIENMNKKAFLNKGSIPINLAYIPVVIPQTVERELYATVNAYLAYIGGNNILTQLRKTVPDWLQTIPFRPFKHGAFDFHLTQDGPKLIEYMAIPAGMVAIMLIAAKEYAKIYGFEFSENDVLYLQDEYTKSFTLGKNVAIVDVEPQKQITYPEFLCLREMWEKRNHKVTIVDPKDLGKTNTIYHRITAPDLEDERLASYRALCIKQPELFDPHPIDWYLGDKNSLVTLSAQKEIPALIQKTLIPTKHIKEFTDWDHAKEYVFKPTSSHANKGVLIYASKSRIKELMNQNYVFQKRVDANSIPYPNKEMKYDIRVCVFNGKPAFTYARVYQGMITKLKEPGTGFAPVFFV